MPRSAEAFAGLPLEPFREDEESEEMSPMPPKKRALKLVDRPISPKKRASGESETGDNLLAKYFHDLKNVKFLSREEEQELVKLYQKTGDVEAKKRLVESQARLVVKMAAKYARGNKNILSDLIQEGNLGLTHAIDKFDLLRGVRLSTFAIYEIRNCIWNYLRKNKGGEASLDEPIYNKKGGKELTLHGLLPSGDLSQEDLLAKAEMNKKVQTVMAQVLRTMVPRERKIVRARLYPPKKGKLRTLQEVANDYGISRERVRQLENRAKEKLRMALRQELGDAVGEEEVIAALKDEALMAA